NSDSSCQTRTYKLEVTICDLKIGREWIAVPPVPLPIDAVLPELLNALRRQPCAVLRAPTGAGKTTRVPPALLASGLVGPGRLVQQTVRPELRLVVMSATLAVDAVAGYLGGCPVVASEGRLHPVEVRYEAPPEGQRLSATVSAAVERLLDRTDGDLLVFLPGL